MWGKGKATTFARKNLGLRKGQEAWLDWMGGSCLLEHHSSEDQRVYVYRDEADTSWGVMGLEQVLRGSWVSLTGLH